MSREQLLKKMARSMEVEGADYKRMEKIILDGIHQKSKK